MEDIVKQRELICAIPKTEVHLHLEGLASVDTLWNLIRQKNLRIGIDTREELVDRFRIHNLNEFIDLFVNVIQASINKKEDIDLLLVDARDYLLRNNIRYAEIFFSPTKLIRNGIPFEEMVDSLTVGAQKIETENGIQMRFITDISRSFGVRNARNNFLHHLRYASHIMIGLGLGGAEQSGGAKHFRRIFRRAKDRGMAVVAHAGEDGDAQNIWDAIRYLRVERIGHATSAAQDPDLMDYLRRTQIPLEICPTSNLYTGRYVHNISEHPIRLFYDQGLNITVNTDDPTLFHTELNQEYCKLLESGLFSIGELIKIIKNGIYATFLPQAQKDALWEQVSNTVKKYNYDSIISSI